MRLIRLAIPVAVLSLVTACGGATTPTATPQTTAAPATSAAPTTSAPPAGGGSMALTATIGEPGKPEDFTIYLKDSTGALVTTLKAGTYQITVKDESKFHNFHLTGTGVEQTTGPVAELAEATWSVTFTPGDYEYKCDPHPNMVETFTVT